jgi:hypothetical protein
MNSDEENGSAVEALPPPCTRSHNSSDAESTREARTLYQPATTFRVDGEASASSHCTTPFSPVEDHWIFSDRGKPPPPSACAAEARTQDGLPRERSPAACTPPSSSCCVGVCGADHVSPIPCPLGRLTAESAFAPRRGTSNIAAGASCLCECQRLSSEHRRPPASMDAAAGCGEIATQQLMQHMTDVITAQVTKNLAPLMQQLVQAAGASSDVGMRTQVALLPGQAIARDPASRVLPLPPVAKESPYGPGNEPVILLFPSEIAKYIDTQKPRARIIALARTWQRSHQSSFQEAMAAWVRRGKRPRKWTGRQVAELYKSDQERRQPADASGGQHAAIGAGHAQGQGVADAVAGQALAEARHPPMQDPYPGITTAADVAQFTATHDTGAVQRLYQTKGKQMEALIAEEFERRIGQPLALRNTSIYWARGMDEARLGPRCVPRPMGRPITDPGPYALSGEMDACLLGPPYEKTPVEFKLRMTRIPDAIPVQDFLQTQAYMTMLDAEQAFHVQMLFGTNDLVINIIKRDDNYWAQVRPKLDAFVCDVRKLLRGAPEDEELRHEAFAAWEATTSQYQQRLQQSSRYGAGMFADSDLASSPPVPTATRQPVADYGHLEPTKRASPGSAVRMHASGDMMTVAADRQAAQPGRQASPQQDQDELSHSPAHAPSAHETDGSNEECRQVAAGGRGEQPVLLASYGALGAMHNTDRENQSRSTTKSAHCQVFPRRRDSGADTGAPQVQGAIAAGRAADQAQPFPAPPPSQQPQQQSRAQSEARMQHSRVHYQPLPMALAMPSLCARPPLASRYDADGKPVPRKRKDDAAPKATRRIVQRTHHAVLGRDVGVVGTQTTHTIVRGGEAVRFGDRDPAGFIAHERGTRGRGAENNLGRASVIPVPHDLSNVVHDHELAGAELQQSGRSFAVLEVSQGGGGRRERDLYAQRPTGSPPSDGDASVDAYDTRGADAGRSAKSYNASGAQHVVAAAVVMSSGHPTYAVAGIDDSAASARHFEQTRVASDVTSDSSSSASETRNERGESTHDAGARQRRSGAPPPHRGRGRELQLRAAMEVALSAAASQLKGGGLRESTGRAAAPGQRASSRRRRQERPSALKRRRAQSSGTDDNQSTCTDDDDDKSENGRAYFSASGDGSDDGTPNEVMDSDGDNNTSDESESAQRRTRRQHGRQKRHESRDDLGRRNRVAARAANTSNAKGARRRIATSPAYKRSRAASQSPTPSQRPRTSESDILRREQNGSRKTVVAGRARRLTRPTRISVRTRSARRTRSGTAW